MAPPAIMSQSSDKKYKRKPSIIVRQHLLNVLLRKYIKKLYGGVIADRAKQIDRQLLRQEYYSDINEYLLNYCQLSKHTKLLKTVNQLTLTNQREFIEAMKTTGSRKRKKVASVNFSSENSRWVVSPHLQCTIAAIQYIDTLLALLSYEILCFMCVSVGVCI